MNEPALSHSGVTVQLASVEDMHAFLGANAGPIVRALLSRVPGLALEDCIVHVDTQGCVTTPALPREGYRAGLEAQGVHGGFFAVPAPAGCFRVVVPRKAEFRFVVMPCTLPMLRGYLARWNDECLAAVERLSVRVGGTN